MGLQKLEGGRGVHRLEPAEEETEESSDYWAFTRYDCYEEIVDSSGDERSEFGFELA